MGNFRYRALTQNGEIVHGMISAATAKEVLHRMVGLAGITVMGELGGIELRQLVHQPNFQHVAFLQRRPYAAIVRDGGARRAHSFIARPPADFVDPAGLGDQTFGDFVFVQIYNSANGMPVPQATHQHGSNKMDYADYRIDIPANHPSGQFWFHPHIHGLSLNQVSAGMAGIISVGEVSDYAHGDVGARGWTIMPWVCRLVGLRNTSGLCKR